MGKIAGWRVAAGIVAGLACATGLPASAPAQLLNQLKGAVGSGDSGGGALGGLGGGGLPSVDHASTGNTAGVLQYCIRNNYVNGGAASSVKQSIMGKVTGGSSDSDYKAGSNGLLQTGNGQSVGLGGGGLKAQATHKVCDMVLKHAKSLL